MIKRDTHAKLNDSAVLAAQDAGLAKLEDVYAGKTFAEGVHLCGIQSATDAVHDDWQRWLDESLDELAVKAGQSLDESVFRPLSVQYNPRGVHHVDHLLGAEVFDLGGDNWQCHLLDSPVGELPPVDLASQQAWRAMQDYTRAFVDREDAEPTGTAWPDRQRTPVLRPSWAASRPGKDPMPFPSSQKSAC